ncbi:MAG: hypothetical protein F6K20_10350, partial [Moorea sp. SIO2C4]|nr:hypothetical protein [Moorena sp. SIO2C4]
MGSIKFDGSRESGVGNRESGIGSRESGIGISIQRSAVSGELKAHAARTALWHRLWPWPFGLLATLRERPRVRVWPRCAND